MNSSSGLLSIRTRHGMLRATGPHVVRLHPTAVFPATQTKIWSITAHMARWQGLSSVGWVVCMGYFLIICMLLNMCHSSQVGKEVSGQH